MMTDGGYPLPAPMAAGPLAPAPRVEAGEDVHVFHDPHALGARLSLHVRTADREAAFASALAVQREIDRLDAVFNWRRPDSEISWLNRSGRWKASEDLFNVVAAAERWRDATRGAVSGRLGLLSDIWRMARRLPDARELAALAGRICEARLVLERASGLIIRPEVVRFDLDALAKGYIVDAALRAAMAVPGVAGALIDIGGDIACSGSGRGAAPWRIDLPEPLSPFENAPLCGAFELQQGAVATSGYGPRDRRIDGEARSVTLDPRTGWPVARERSATALAGSAMEADLFASAMLVMGPAQAQEHLTPGPGQAGRIAHPDGAGWLGGAAPAQWRDAPQRPPSERDVYQSGWEPGWTADITFTAPPKDMRQAIALRSPYVAIWVSNAERRTVRTLLLIGTVKEWQEKNHVWWRLNRGNTDRLLNNRSMSTRGSGIYRIYWDGVDDEGRPVGPGAYTFHVETSREAGGHEERTLAVVFRQGRPVEAELPLDGATGGLRVAFRRL